MVDLVVVEEVEETAAGWRSPEMRETGPNQHHVTNDLNSESVLLLVMRAELQTGKVGEFDTFCRKIRKLQERLLQLSALYCQHAS